MSQPTVRASRRSQCMCCHTLFWSSRTNNTSAFPTAYQYYQPSYTINGTLPTKVGANPACLRVPSGKSSAFPFPSHPQLPQYTQVPTQDPDGRDALNERFAQDPKGWTWNPPADSVSPGDVIVENADDFSDAVKPLFPNLGVWSCPSNPMAAAAPEVDVETALYLTQTSTSMESDDGETTTAPQSSVNQASSSQRAPMAAAADQTSAQSSEGTSSKAATSPEQQIATPTSTVLSQGELQGLQQTVPASTLKASTPHLSSSLNAGGVNTLSPLPEVTPSSVVDKPQPITVNGQPITPNAQSLYLVSGQSLALGSSITLGSGTSNTIVALQTSKGDTVLVVGSSSSSLLPAVTPAPVVTIGTRTVQANSQGQYIIGSQTLTAGGVVTISKTPVSLAPGGSQVVVGSSTETVAESSGSVGGAVIAAFQGASNGMAVPRIFSFSFIALALVLNFT